MSLAKSLAAEGILCSGRQPLSGDICLSSGHYLWSLHVVTMRSHYVKSLSGHVCLLEHQQMVCWSMSVHIQKEVANDDT